MTATDRPTTRICSHTAEAIYIRGRNLVEDMIGRMTFTEMTFFAVMGRAPSGAEVAILDAVLVTLMEHGMTPSTIAARLIYMSSPEALQAAVAAGLLAVGDRFVGTMEGAASLLEEIATAAEGAASAARRIALAHHGERRPIPGFGHPFHKPDDPRTPKLLAVAEGQRVPGAHIGALRTLSAAIDEVRGRHLTINATGAVVAVLLEIGVPARLMRGFALLSRTAGLIAHIGEEQEVATARHIWAAAEAAVPYDGDAPARRTP